MLANLHKHHYKKNKKITASTICESTKNKQPIYAKSFFSCLTYHLTFSVFMQFYEYMYIYTKLMQAGFQQSHDYIDTQEPKCTCTHKPVQSSVWTPDIQGLIR